MPLDAAAVSLDGAIGAILELTGERTTEAVVDEVFFPLLRGEIRGRRSMAVCGPRCAV